MSTAQGVGNAKRPVTSPSFFLAVNYEWKLPLHYQLLKQPNRFNWFLLIDCNETKRIWLATLAFANELPGSPWSRQKVRNFNAVSGTTNLIGLKSRIRPHRPSRVYQTCCRRYLAYHFQTSSINIGTIRETANRRNWIGKSSRRVRPQSIQFFWGHCVSLKATGLCHIVRTLP